MTGVEARFLDNDGLTHAISVNGDVNSTLHGNFRFCGHRTIEATKCLRGLALHVGDQKAITTAQELQLADGVALIIRNDGEGTGHAMVALTTPSVLLQVDAILMNDHELGHKTLHHVDLDLSQYRPSGMPGGLLGETVEVKRGQNGEPIMKGPACFGGDEDAFIVDGVRPATLRDSEYAQTPPLSANVDGDSAM